MKRLVLLLLLGGCATAGLKPAPPPLPPEGYSFPVVQQTGPTLGSVLAGDPALAPLLTAAHSGSPDLESAAARVLQARAGLKAAGAQLAPNVSAGISANRTRQSLDQFSFDIPGGALQRDRTTIQPSLEVGWELDLFGRLAAGRKAAESRLDAATADAAATRLSLDTEVARNLVAIRALDARAAAAADAAAAARTLDHLARVRAEAGLVTGLDVATTNADVAGAEAAIPPLLAQRAARVASLSRLTGLSVDRVLPLLQPTAALPQSGSWSIPDVPSTLLQRRPDIRAAASRLSAADAEVAAAMAARFPSFTLTGSLGWLTTAISGLFTGDAFTATAGALLSGPLLDFGRTAAEIERNRGVAAEATALYRAAVLDALAETETALSAARGARAQAADLDRSAAALSRARSLAETQYRGGLTDARAVSESQRRLADARDRQLAAEGEALDAALRLELATGGPLVPAAEGR